MAQVTYGSITLVDLTDVGQLSVYPTSNMPLSIIYDPDRNTYTPNWGTNNLVLSPTVFYNATQLTSSATITWQRRVGIEAATNLTTGETQLSNGNLQVTANQFNANSSMLTYIVTAEYTEPETGRLLRAQGQITFSLVKLASSIKSCVITGENIFKYRADGSHASSSSITLTAAVNRVTIQKWQYKNASGVWTDYPNLTTSQMTDTTLTVNDTDAIFINDNIATIRAYTSDPNIFDVHMITKLRDGAPGDKAVSAVLTNENQRIPCDSNGNPVDHAFDNAICQIIIYNGGVNDTTNWTITPTASTGVTIARTYATTQTNDTVKIGGLTTPTGNVTFTCSRQGEGYSDIIKTFSLVKVEAGQDAVSPTIHSLDCSAIAINKTTPSTAGATATYSPSTVEITAYEQTGDSPKTQYGGWLWIKAGNEDIHKTNGNEEAGSYTITSSDMATASSAANYMTVELYASGSFNTLLDTQTIVFTSDGAQGEQGNDGQPGTDAINILMSNPVDAIPCDADNKVIRATPIDIPFAGYKGITQVNCTIPSPPTLVGVSAKTPLTPCTPTQVGHLIYEIPAGTTISAESGTITITFRCEGKDIPHVFTWTRSSAARDGVNGQNARLFELFTTQGNVFISRDPQTITIRARMMDGSTDVTSSVTNWKWYRYVVGSGYQQITGETSSTLEVSNTTVDGYASFMCTCSYDNKNDFVAYYSLIDKLDPIQATVFCSLGEQIVNGQGIGAFYVIVTDTGTGQELDTLKTDRFLTVAPSNPSTGDFYYHLDSTNKTIALKKYNGSSWINAPNSDCPKGKYTWSFRDSSGQPTLLNGQSEITNATGDPGIKAIYIDGTLVSRKIIVDVKVEI